jgi:hypothetical protein
VGRIPAGDVLGPLIRLARGIEQRLVRHITRPATWMHGQIRQRIPPTPAQPPTWHLAMEQNLSLWPIAGSLALLTVAALLLLLWIA